MRCEHPRALARARNVTRADMVIPRDSRGAQDLGERGGAPIPWDRRPVPSGAARGRRRGRAMKAEQRGTAGRASGPRIRPELPAGDATPSISHGPSGVQYLRTGQDPTRRHRSTPDRTMCSGYLLRCSTEMPTAGRWAAPAPVRRDVATRRTFVTNEHAPGDQTADAYDLGDRYEGLVPYLHLTATSSL
jgi:hypothetical protein